MTLLEHTAETGIEPTPALKYLRRAWPAIPSFALREALIKELIRRYRTCTYEDASSSQRGGAMLVTIN